MFEIKERSCFALVFSHFWWDPSHQVTATRYFQSEMKPFNECHANVVNTRWSWKQNIWNSFDLWSFLNLNQRNDWGSVGLVRGSANVQSYNWLGLCWWQQHHRCRSGRITFWHSSRGKVGGEKYVSHRFLYGILSDSRNPNCMFSLQNRWTVCFRCFLLKHLLDGTGITLDLTVSEWKVASAIVLRHGQNGFIWFRCIPNDLILWNMTIVSHPAASQSISQVFIS